MLAAGAAARLGHRPKCLLELDGEALIRRLLHAILHSGVGDIVVVLGRHAARIAPVIANLPVTLAYNPSAETGPDTGQNASLHIGLRALPPTLGAVLVALADQPLLDASDIGALLQAYRERPPHTDMLVPTRDDLPGNPVLFSAGVRAAILAREPSWGGRQWRQTHPDCVYRWQAPNAHYHIDIDTAADIDAFVADTGRQLLWPASPK